MDAGVRVLLGSYAAKQCPVRIHNDHAPLVPEPEWEWPEEIKADPDADRQFEVEVFAQLLRIHPTTAIQVDPDLRKSEAIAATLTAVKSGIPLVLGGWLPDDPAGDRTGRPDILEGKGSSVESRRPLMHGCSSVMPTRN